MAEPNNTIVVTDDYGTIKYADADEVAREGLPAGYRQASPEEAERARLQDEYGGAGHAVGALATGVAKGATLGLSDVAISELVPGGRELLQAQEKVHGGLRAGGEVAGGVGALFVPGGGTGLLARGARAVSAPARFALRAGQAVEGAAAGTRLGRLGGMALGAATEGALYGAGEALSEASIYDTELTGEHLATSIGYSALLGGGTTFGLGAAGRLLGKAGTQTASLLTRSMKSVDGQPGTFARILGGMSDVVSGAPSGRTARFLSDADYTRLAVNAPEVIEQQSKHLLDGLESFHNTQERFRSLYSGALKADEVAAKITKGNERATRAAMQEMADDFATKLDDVVANKDAISQKGVKDLRRDLKQLQSAIQKGDNATMFMRADAFKRSLGEAAYRKLGAGVTKPSQQALYRTLDDMYEQGVRPMLENQALWGGAAEMQRAINAAWTPFIRAGQETGIPGLLAKTVKGDKGLKQRIFNRERVAKSIRGLGGTEKEQLLASLNRYMDEGQRFAEAARKNRSALEAGDATLADELGRGIDDIRRRVGKLQEVEQAAADLASLKELNNQGDLVGGAAGYMLGGLGGGLAGGALGMLRNPHGMVTKLAAVRELASKASRKMDGAATALFDMATPTARRLAQAADRPKDPRRTAQEKAKRAKYVADNAEQVQAEMRDGLAGLQDHAPLAVDGAVTAAMRANEYLMGHLPQAYTTPDGRELPPPREQATQYLQRLRAIEDPSVILSDIADGKLTGETIDAVRAYAPAMYEEMRAQVATEYGELRAEGKDLPYSQRLQIGRLLEIPTDPTMTPGVMGLLREMYAMTPQPDEPGAPQGAGNQGDGYAPSLSGAFRTESERLAAVEE